MGGGKHLGWGRGRVLLGRAQSLWEYKVSCSTSSARDGQVYLHTGTAGRWEEDGRARSEGEGQWRSANSTENLNKPEGILPKALLFASQILPG